MKDACEKSKNVCEKFHNMLHALTVYTGGSGAMIGTSCKILYTQKKSLRLF
jgi:hypothetical protein